MKLLLSAIPLVFSCVFGFSQEKVQECTTDKNFDLKPTFKTCHVAYNNDKKKLLHGNYKDGQKVGVWSYYDNDGKLLLKRNYFNNLSYEPVFPKLPKAHKEIGVGLVVTKERDSLGILPFYYVHEKDMVWSKRFYQLNWLEDHKSMVSQEIMTAALTQLLQDTSIMKYRTTELKETFTFQTETLKEYTIIGFLTRTEAFFDAARQLGEMRTITLQPLARNTVGDTILMPAVYYPEARKNLSSFAIKSFDYIQHVDDLLYYSLFDGPIYPIPWKNDKINTRYLSRFENENCFSQREMSFIKTELEHQIRYFNGVKE